MCSWMGGEIISNVVVGGANFSDSTSLHKFIVPTGKRWYVFQGSVAPDVSATVSVAVFDDSNRQLFRMGNVSASTTVSNYPNNSTATTTAGAFGPVPLKAGWYISVTFGAGQGATAIVAMIIIEVDE